MIVEISVPFAVGPFQGWTLRGDMQQPAVRKGTSLCRPLRNEGGKYEPVTDAFGPKPLAMEKRRVDTALRGSWIVSMAGSAESLRISQHNPSLPVSLSLKLSKVLPAQAA